MQNITIYSQSVALASLLQDQLEEHLAVISSCFSDFEDLASRAALDQSSCAIFDISTHDARWELDEVSLVSAMLCPSLRKIILIRNIDSMARSKLRLVDAQEVIVKPASPRFIVERCAFWLAQCTWAENLNSARKFDNVPSEIRDNVLAFPFDKWHQNQTDDLHR